MPWTIKTTFSFAGFEQGFSETFYWNSSTNDLAAAAAIIGPIARKRADLLAAGYTLTQIRNATVLNDVGVKVTRRSDLIEPRMTGVAGWDPAAPQLALMAEWQNALANQSKLIYMRGIPARLGEIGKTPNMGFASFQSRWNAYVTAMVNLPAGWMSRSVAQSAVITNWVMNAQNGQVALTLGGPGINWSAPVGGQQRVYLAIPGKSPLDGEEMVVVQSATSCYTVRGQGVAPHQDTQVGQLRVMAYTLVTMAAGVGGGAAGLIDPRRIVSHKTGSPSYASRGRAPARRTW